ncbi:MAG: Rieske (2Fe-2S) protein [Blastocatellia bacterium]|nr:Rieske (2Fe-2S) protein [Blastocatellia bacterium]
MLTSFAFSVGQFWIAFLSLRQKAEPATRVKIGTVAALPVGKSLVFAYPGEHDKCVLTRVEENTFTAYSQACTHLSCAVIPEPEKGRLFCPCHEGAFDLKTGQPIAGPPRRPLPRIQLDIRGGEIFATGIAPEERSL